MRLLVPVLALAALAVAAPAASAQTTSAVVLVSGFSTSTPFSTSDPTCAGKEGGTWSASVAPALKAAGYTVFTAPEGDNNANPSDPGPPPPPCLGPGQAAPPFDVTLNTGGDVDQNGARLGAFLAFLQETYGITNVQLVGHSDGGIWSRAAITQKANFPGVTVSSLTTLGTPHEGSYVADLALGLDGLDCTSPTNPIIRALCDGAQNLEKVVSQELGPAALAELTSTFMATWNPAQSIGGCPVTTVAGTYVQVPYIGWLIPRYYAPNDGVVGQASALAQQSTLINLTTVNPPNFPNLIEGGTFPVVHSPTLGFLTPENLLNQPAITSVVQSAVTSGATNTTACAQGPSLPTSSPPSAPSSSSAYRSASAAASGPATMTLDPIVAVGASDATELPPTRKRDFIVAKRGAAVRCGRKVFFDKHTGGLRSAVFMAVPACSHKLRVAGGRAIILRRDARRLVRLRTRGDHVNVRGTGAPVEKLEAQVSTGGAYRRLALDRSGNGTLPADNNGTKVRVLLTVRRNTPRETAVATLAR